MQDNSEWQIDIQSVIKKLITGKNIILIIILTLFGLIVGLIAYPSVAKNINYEVKVEILPTTELQNPMSGYMTTDDMLREFGMSIRSIKNEYVGEINDYGFEKKYSRIIYSTSIIDFDKKIYLEKEEFLLDFILKIIILLLKEYEVNIPIHRVSKLNEQGYDITGTKSDLIVKMCESVKAKNFVFGILGRDYMDKQTFIDNDINYYFQNWENTKRINRETKDVTLGQEL